MDQFISLHGQANHVLKLDCRSLDYQMYPLDMSDFVLVLVNTGVSHELASSEYNKRRETCEAGVAILQKYDPEIESLRDVPLRLLDEHKDELTEV